MSTVHLGAKIQVYPGDFLPIMKALRFATLSPDFIEHVVTDEDDRNRIIDFLDELSDLALEHSYTPVSYDEEVN
jgi:hypothetical protein